MSDTDSTITELTVGEAIDLLDGLHDGCRVNPRERDALHLVLAAVEADPALADKREATRLHLLVARARVAELEQQLARVRAAAGEAAA